MPELTGALIISDGGPAALAAAWSEGVIRRRLDGAEDAAGPVLWFAPVDLPARPLRREAVVRQVELCRAADLIQPPLTDLTPDRAGAQPDGIPSGPDATRLLLDAAAAALRLGLRRVIWPVQIGADGANLSLLAAIHDRAMLVAALATIDAQDATPGIASQPQSETSGFKIETPYLDFTDVQLMDLLIDLDAPIRASWWCTRSDAVPSESGPMPGCGSCAACLRWRRAMAAANPAGIEATVIATTPPAAASHRGA